MVATLLQETDTVLIVDDNAPSRRALARLLYEAGFAVLEADTGEEGLRLLADGPDLVVLDVFLPDVDGYEVCRCIKSEPETADIPVMMVSGVAVDSRDRVHGLETGADAYLPKPIEPDELVAHAKALLRVRHAEEALRASERRFRAIIEKSFDAVLLIRADGTIAYASPSSARILGYTPDELAGLHSFELLHPEDRRTVEEAFSRRLQDVGDVVTVNWRGRHQNGTWRWLEAVCTNLLDEPGVEAIVCNFRDVTDQWRAEESLHKEREFLRAVLDHVADGIVACDARGVISLLNPASREFAGPAVGPAPIAEWSKNLAFYQPDGRTPMPTDDQPLIRALRGELVSDTELILAPPNGPARTLLASGQPLDDAHGNRLGAVVALHDITERRRLERQYHQAQKMEAVGRLAGGIAHDFNNLLTIINGYAELLAGVLPVSGRAGDMLGQVRQAGERAASLTRQLLAFSRQQVLTPQALDLNAAVANMEKMLQRVIGEDIELAIALQPDLRPVKADPSQVEQVMLNLVLNARDAMPRGGRLTIETQAAKPGGDAKLGQGAGVAGRAVVLIVRDTGVGMTDEVKTRVFEPFFTTKEVGKGTGLGLATVYGIVQQSGGHVEVESEPGRGSTFRVYLPESAESAKPKSDADCHAAPRGSETILLVEDEDAVRSLSARILRGSGYTVLEASHGAEALAVCEKHPEKIDLLVSDVVMPGMGGRELAERLCPLRPAMKVLFISGYTDDTIVRLGVREAEVNFLQKPFLPAELARKVRKVLDADPSSARMRLSAERAAGHTN